MNDDHQICRFVGNVSYKTDVSKVYIGINKITNKGNNRSGALRLRLIKS